MQRYVGQVWIGIIAGVILIGTGFWVNSLVMILGLIILGMNVVVNIISRVEAKEAMIVESKDFPYGIKHLEVL